MVQPLRDAGQFTVQYRIQNTTGFSDATVTVTVTNINQAPTAQPDALAADTGVANNYPAPGVFGDNGSGPDDLGTPTATLVSFGGGSLGGSVTDTAAGSTIGIPVLGGSLTVNPDGSVTVGNPTLGGQFTFQYHL